MPAPAIKSIPLMYHPTNVVFLDDDPKFLHNLCMNLALTIPYVDSTDPQKIMDYLTTHTYKQDALSAMLIKPVYDRLDVTPGAAEVFSVDLTPIIATLTSPDRFKKTVHGMFDRAIKQKEFDGVDFCNSIREKGIAIKIHLFTGQTTSDEAVQFFNQKVIDGFLPKEEDYVKLTKKVNELIRIYTWQQFVDLSEKLSGLLSHVLKPLRDEQFINIFMRIFEKYKIVEFYLLDSSCSFLMIDADGKAKQLFVKNDADFKDCYEIAENANVPSEILQAIRGRQMFPYTGKLGYEDLKADQWQSTMVYMDRVPGRELYYTVIDRPDVEVFSFNKYQKEEWPKP